MSQIRTSGLRVREALDHRSIRQQLDGLQGVLICLRQTFSNGEI